MNEKITYYIGLLMFFVGLWAFFSLVSTGIYNPYAASDYYLGTDAWSKNNQELRFYVQLPQDRIFSVNKDGRNLHLIYAIPENESSANSFADTPMSRSTSEF